VLVVEAGGHQFVAPDNGLLTPQLRAGGEAWSVTRRELFLDVVAGGGVTFHGRDRFAPIAAALLRGERPSALGEPITDAVRLAIPKARRESEGENSILHGRVVRVDRFGNLITDLPAAWLDDADDAGGVTIRLDQGEAGVIGPVRRLHRVRFYDELLAGQPGILVGSLGTLELALRGESLAARWAIRRGAAVRVEVSTRGGDGAAPRRA
jgi:hypothetical protein